VRVAGVFHLFAAIAVVSLAMTHASITEDYPARPLKLLVGAPAGGTTDTIARAISEPMAAALKQPVLVENRPGAGGNLAAAAVAKSAPDGYTLLVSFSSHTINATLYGHLLEILSGEMKRRADAADPDRHRVRLCLGEFNQRL